MLFLLILAFLGCASPHPAPEALQEVLPWMFQHWDEAADEEIAKYFVQMEGAATPVNNENPMKGTIGNLQAENVAKYNLDPGVHDVSKARGVFIFNAFKCSLHQLERVLIDRDQTNLYPDQYLGYERIYSTNADDYKARKTNFLRWQTNLTASKTVATLTETLEGGVRFIPDLGKEKSPYGAAIVQWTLMPNPASLDDPSYFWKQDYQIEMYTERAPGEILHAYGMWRQVYVTSLFDSNTDGFVSRVTGALIDWDKMTEDDCAAGRP